MYSCPCACFSAHARPLIVWLWGPPCRPAGTGGAGGGGGGMVGPPVQSVAGASSPDTCADAANDPAAHLQPGEDGEVDLVLDVVWHLLAGLLVHRAHALGGGRLVGFLAGCALFAGSRMHAANLQVRTNAHAQYSPPTHTQHTHARTRSTRAPCGRRSWRRAAPAGSCAS